jgi:CBS domain-containing protein
MSKPPAILIVDDEPQVLNAIERDLRRHYRTAYRILKSDSGHAALDLLRTLQERREQVALLLSDQRMPGLDGAHFLAQARPLFPKARKVLLTAYADTEAAIASINQAGIDHYLLKPWSPPEEKLYPILDDLLADWQADVRLPYMRVKGVMMTRIARIRQDANLHHAAEIVALSGVGDLMVVDAEGNFVGVLSERAILRAALPDIDAILDAGGTLEDAYGLFLRRGQDLAAMPILPFVIQEPFTIAPDDHVAKAATLFASHEISRLPVLDQGRLVGTVARADICQAVVGTFASLTNGEMQL